MVQPNFKDPETVETLKKLTMWRILVVFTVFATVTAIELEHDIDYSTIYGGDRYEQGSPSADTSSEEFSLRGTKSPFVALYEQATAGLQRGAVVKRQSIPTIRIGRTVSLLGVFAAEAGSLINGTDLAVKYINDNGGVTVNGTRHNIQLVTWNDASDVALVKRLYTDMILFDDVDVLIGPWATGLTGEPLKVAYQYQWPMVFSGASSTQFYTSGYNTSFGMLVQAGKRSLPCMELLISSLGVTKVAIVSSDDSFQLLSANLIAGQVKTRNATIIFNETVSRLLTTPEELGDIPLRLTQTDAELVVICMATGVNNVFLEALREFDWDPAALYITNSETVVLSERAIGWKVAGAFAGNQWSPRLPYNDSVRFGDAAGFGQFYQNVYNVTPSFLAAAGAEAIFVIADALERAGSLERTDIIQSLRLTKIPETFFGPVSFLVSGELNSSCACEQIQPIGPHDQKNRSMATVYPGLLADATVIYPAFPERPPGPKYTEKELRLIYAFSALAGCIVLGLLVLLIVYLFRKNYHLVFLDKDRISKDVNDTWA